MNIVTQLHRSSDIYIYSNSEIKCYPGWNYISKLAQEKEKEMCKKIQKVSWQMKKAAI